VRPNAEPKRCHRARDGHYAPQKDAEAAARFYAETFPNSAVGGVHRAPSDYPSGKEGDVLTVEFTVAGVPASTAMISKRPTAKSIRH
jgi:predicted 3-demethylubiquinone-9 3-methyltransferase (glyoxalase superfamily)